MMYPKNESLAHRPIYCMLIFETPEGNIVTDPPDIGEYIPMS